MFWTRGTFPDGRSSEVEGNFLLTGDTGILLSELSTILLLGGGVSGHGMDLFVGSRIVTGGAWSGSSPTGARLLTD